MGRQLQALGFGVMLCATSTAHAQTIPLTEDRSDARFEISGQTFVIERSAELAAQFLATTVDPETCPPDCILPMVVAPGVTTIAELETIRFLETFVGEGRGLLIDSRSPADFAAGTIPGAVNVPDVALAPGNPYLGEILAALGAQNQGGGALTFSDALDIAVFGAGPTSSEAKRTIENLLAAGYPPGKLSFYRDGMRGWQSMGLTVIVQPSEG